MRSIDIRSEPAVRLLSDFLDVRGSEGRERQGTEHFVHGESNCLVVIGAGLRLIIRHRIEFVAFLRSPYRDLAVYDAVVQVSVLTVTCLQ
jgi:hypothetical protein